MAEEIKNTPEVKVRYSDEELKEFKAIILEMLEKAKKEYLRKEIPNKLEYQTALTFFKTVV